MRAGLGLVAGLVALLPAALGAAPAHEGKGLTVLICGGGGPALVLVAGPGHQDIPGAEQPGCCAKGCQTGTRKRRRAQAD